MSWGIVATVGGSIIAGSMSANAAGSAADTQAASADRATEEQRRQYDLNRSDLQPFMKTGVAGNARLAYLLGLSPSAGGATGVGGSTAAPDRQTLRNQLIGQFTSTPTSTPAQPRFGGMTDSNAEQMFSSAGPQASTVDEAGLNAAVQAELDKQQASSASADQASAAAASSDPAYGSLLKKFSTDDLNADPVYQSGLKFGLDQGTGGVNARAIQGGGYDSGATLKALTRYATDYGSTKANESFNRYNIANDSTYNKLAGVSGSGQTATNQAVASGTNIANNIGGLMTDSGNARAAGIVGGANAWGGALSGVSQAANNYSNNQWLKSLLSKNGSVNLGTSTGSDASLFYG